MNENIFVTNRNVSCSPAVTTMAPLTKRMYVNIACGDTYVEDWSNYDYVPDSSAVRYANLLKRLPISDGAADIVYSSHFLEHIPRNLLLTFLSECFRITKPGGRLRLVLPDFDELCRTYLAERERGAHEEADFVAMEMLDQCVRTVSGGELGAYYSRVQANSTQRPNLMEEYIRQRTGHVIQSHATGVIGSVWRRALKNPALVLNRLVGWYCRAVLVLLPFAFRQQNVSLTAVGERHAWIYDFYTVDKLLRQTGFVGIEKMTAATSNIPDFPFYTLDLTKDGQPRKGAESMYIEAIKP